MHQLNVVPVDFLLLIFLIDFLLYCRTGKEDVESHLVSGRHLVTVSPPSHLVVVRVEGRDPKLGFVLQDRIDVEVGGQLRYFRLVMSAVSQVPHFEIFAFLFASLDFNVGVTVRSELRHYGFKFIILFILFNSKLDVTDTC